MTNYFYKWIPLFVIGMVALLGLPWLGLVALLLVLLVLLGAFATLALGIASAIGTVGRAVGHGYHLPSGAEHAVAPALSPARSAPTLSYTFRSEGVDR
jgi:hypothetical protein